MKDPYKLPRGWVVNPFDFLYQRDVEFSKEPEIQELLEFANELEDSISGEIESRIEYYEFSFRFDSLAFVRQGLILAKLKFWRCYRKKYSTFKEYCENVIGKSVSYCNRLIASAGIMTQLIGAGYSQLPYNESQCRILSCLSGSELLNVWEAAKSTIPRHKITAKSIEDFLLAKEEPEPEPDLQTQINLSEGLEQAIFPYSNAFKMSIAAFVLMLLDEIFNPVKLKANWRDFQKEEEWRNDLDKLVEEGISIINSA